MKKEEAKDMLRQLRSFASAAERAAGALETIVGQLGRLNEDEYLTEKEAALLLKCSTAHLRRNRPGYIRRGAKCMELETQGAGKRAEYRWLRSSLLGLVRGIGDARRRAGL